MIRNMFFSALLVAMFMVGPVHAPVPAVPRERIVYIYDFTIRGSSQTRKKKRNHYRRLVNTVSLVSQNNMSIA